MEQRFDGYRQGMAWRRGGARNLANRQLVGVRTDQPAQVRYAIETFLAHVTECVEGVAEALKSTAGGI